MTDRRSNGLTVREERENVCRHARVQCCVHDMFIHSHFRVVLHSQSLSPTSFCPPASERLGNEVMLPHKYSPPFNGSRCHFSRHIRERFRVFALESLLYLSHGSYLGEMLGQVFLAHPIDSCVSPPFPKEAGHARTRNDACILGAQHTCRVCCLTQCGYVLRVLSATHSRPHVICHGTYRHQT